MTCLIDLPDVPLQYLFGYLTAVDALNLRLTCSKMFHVSKCKDFYENVCIVMSKIKEIDLKLFQNLCDEFASSLRFNTEGCFEERLEWILPYVQNVKDILVNIKDLKSACTAVKHMKHLFISYIYTDDLRLDDIDFSCLSAAKELDQLSIKGSIDSFQMLFLYQPMIYDILEYAKQISKISFNSIYVEKKKDFAQDLLSEKIRKSNHIRKWHLKNVHSDEGIFNLPTDIRVLECRHTDGFSFKDCNFPKLEKLVLESVKFKEKFITFENLRNLEITGHLRGNGLDGKTVVCPKLEILRLFRINHIGDFQHLVADRLKVLHISIFQDISNKEIGWILRKRPTITKFIRCVQYSSEGIVAPKMSRSKTEKKYKPTFSGKCKSVVQLLCCQNYLIKSSKKR